MIISVIGLQCDIVYIDLNDCPLFSSACAVGISFIRATTWCMSSRKVAGPFVNPNGITFHLDI